MAYRDSGNPFYEGADPMSTGVYSFVKNMLGGLDETKAQRLAQKMNEAKYQQDMENMARDKAANEIMGQMGTKYYGNTPQLPVVPTQSPVMSSPFDPSTPISGLMAPNGPRMGVPGQTVAQQLQNVVPGNGPMSTPMPGAGAPMQGQGMSQPGGLLSPPGQPMRPAFPSMGSNPPAEQNMTAITPKQYNSYAERLQAEGRDVNEAYATELAGSLFKTDPRRAAAIMEKMYSDKAARAHAEAVLVQDWRKHQENKASKAVEQAEANRHNVSTEAIEKQKADTAAKKAAKEAKAPKPTEMEMLYTDYLGRAKAEGFRPMSREGYNIWYNGQKAAKGDYTRASDVAPTQQQGPVSKADPLITQQQGPAAPKGPVVGKKYNMSDGSVKTYKGNVGGRPIYE